MKGNAIKYEQDNIDTDVIIPVVVLIQISSLANTPMCAPQQAPQVGGPTVAPASKKILINPKTELLNLTKKH